MPRIFLLSPANCGGQRAQMILSGRAQFDLAVQLRTTGAPLGDVFSFLSGLYFRGKLAYARAFARPADPDAPLSGGGTLVITPNAGLRPPDTVISIGAIRAFAAVNVHASNAPYREPLDASARRLRGEVGSDTDVVLLGSIASAKYADVLTAIFGERLVFPSAFVGRGDMSRGGLLLRSVAAGEELAYEPVIGAVRHGPRPPRLVPLSRAKGAG